MSEIKGDTMSKKVFKERQFNLGIVESYKKSESKDSAILGSFNVKGMTVENMVSQNKTKYSEAVWKQPTAFGKGGKFLDENGKLKPSTLFGSVDHPIDNRAELLLQEAAIAWYDVKRNENGSWDGSAHILNNPQGRIVKTFLDYANEVGGGELLGVSSRALGESQLVEAGGEQVEAIVPESFELMSFDFVYNPSFQTAVARINESTGRKRTVLAESVRKLANDDNLNADIYTNFANKIEKIDEEYKENNKKEVALEGKSLKTAKEKYLRELRQEEKRLHDALHELKMMSDDEFAQTNSGDRSKLLKVVKEEYDEICEAIDTLEKEQEGVTMVEDMTEESKMKETKKAVMQEESVDTVKDELVEEIKEETETVEAPAETEAVEAPVEAEEVEAEVNESTDDNDDKEVITEAEGDEEMTEEEMSDLEAAAEEVAEEIEDTEEELEVETSSEPTLGELSAEIMALKELLQELRDFLMPVEDAEIEVPEEDEAPEEDAEEDSDEEESGEPADDLGIDLDEEDLDTLSDEELEYLANLEL